MIQYKKLLMTLALLLTAVTGAWADEETPLTTITPTGDGTYSETTAGAVTVTPAGSFFYSNSSYGWRWDDYGSLTVTANEGYTITRCVFIQQGKNQSVTISEAPFALNFEAWLCYENSSMDGVTSIEVYGTYEPPIEVAWNAETKTGTFTMPGSDVVLTPIYAAASILHEVSEDEVIETAYETLKEAFANVQDGDVITLDWNVTLTEDLKTPTIQGGAKFILDFNGYTLDCGTNYIRLTNAGDELTLKDTSGKDKQGGLKCIGTNAVENAKYIFDSGRYKFGEYSTAEYMNALYATTDGYELADGKEFIDIANGPDADDFNLTVGYATFELTIGAGRFATFFENNNIELIEPTEGVTLYTITEVNDDRTEATIKELTGIIDGNSTPMLVYNGTANPVTVKLKGTNAASNENNPTPAEEFMGTDGPQEFTADDMAEADYYALSGGKLFVPVYEPGILGAHQCYLWFYYGSGDTTESDAPARGITLVFEKEEATGVNEVSEVNEVSDDSWYDLSGRKLDGIPTKKGVYILNGKKVVIK